MNWHKTKNFIFHLVKLAILVILAISAVSVVIVLVSDNYQRVTPLASVITAIATAILARTAFVTYHYAKQQLDLMRKYNGARYIEKILELRDNVSDSYLEASEIRHKIVKISKPANDLYDKEDASARLFYSRLNHLCMYLLSLAEGKDKKELSINDLDIRSIFLKDFKKIREIEEPTMNTEDFSNDFPMIHRLFDAWNIKKSD